ncbi:transcriptional regulator, TetR family [Cohaesibacter sp. ES.047]|uniref:TetR family transcriptional regulator C-terminal domain-containing protein n=1 Tax=Cohaesibacter sp. ES.047 TaxID=1798205 RepID=UPI000BB7B762|nr:TetR family transcriptional regulator C-terminal domain-containing protein [Cohaesibacter sp. ES.047]SNY92962.1 transcriptional regulator, TetR family [Cohaesibacter sp. ES.047]
MEAHPATKQQLNREKNIEKILSAAEIIFAEFGYSGASISKIAEAAGLPKSNIVYYFSTKELLYRTVVEDIFTVWREAADELHVDADPKFALSSYIDTKLELARTRPYGSKVWANEIIQGAPIVQDYLESELRSWTNERVEVINKWIANGKIRPISPKHLLFAIWATSQHYADFKHQITTLNDGNDLSDAQWQETKQAVKELLLFGVCT